MAHIKYDMCPCGFLALILFVVGSLAIGCVLGGLIVLPLILIPSARRLGKQSEAPAPQAQ
jgi:hypothetical protein